MLFANRKCSLERTRKAHPKSREQSENDREICKQPARSRKTMSNQREVRGKKKPETMVEVALGLEVGVTQSRQASLQSWS